MGKQFVTVAKRKGSKITDPQSFTIETDQPTKDHMETLAKFFLWSLEHDGVLKG